MLRRTLLASAGAMALAAVAQAAEPLPPPPPPQWAGPYVGFDLGGTWSSNNNITTNSFSAVAPRGFAPLTNTSVLLATTRLPVQISGFIGGGQWGYNYQWNNNWVIGAEGDFQGIATSNRRHTRFSTATAFGTPLGDLTVNQLAAANRGLDWIGTERVRVGFLLWPTFLVYGTGGLAYGETQTGVFIAQTNPLLASTIASGRFNQTLAGWTAGGGGEWLFAPNWSLKVEYLYYDLGGVTFGLSAVTHSNLANGNPLSVTDNLARTRFNGNIVRAGLNYHFNWLPAPVVAKY